jgi:glycosyltransferase involved in cell wall biosynthesis
VHILHVIPYLHPSAGGPPVVVENFARETLRMGHSAEIISTPLLCDGDASTVLQRLNAVAPTTFISQARTRVPFHRSAWRHIGAAVRNADIVHLHTLWNPINVVVRRECARYRRPYVLMPHGMLDPVSLSMKRWRKALYLWTIERTNLMSADRLIYTTGEEARLARSTNLSLPNGVVIPLGADAPIADRAALAAQFLTRFPHACGRRQLLFLGRLHSKKGLDRVLKVLPSIVQSFPDVLLTVAGSGAPGYEAAVRDSIVAQGLQQNVLMTGRLDGAAKWGAYACAELFLLPSRQENFAITVAEAMQMGVPVVISDKVNIWPYVLEAGAGRVLNDNEIEGALEQELLRLLAAPNAIKAMGESGRDFARKNLTWPRAVACLLKCYGEVLASRTASHNALTD